MPGYFVEAEAGRAENFAATRAEKNLLLGTDRRRKSAFCRYRLFNAIVVHERDLQVCQFCVRTPPVQTCTNTKTPVRGSCWPGGVSAVSPFREEVLCMVSG